MAASTGGRRRHSGAAKEENEESLREANSAVQLDRDVQKSRRGTDDAKQVNLTSPSLKKKKATVSVCVKKGQLYCIAVLTKNI